MDAQNNLYQQMQQAQKQGISIEKFLMQLQKTMKKNDETIKKLDEEIKKNDEEIKKNDEEIKKKDEEIKKKDEEIKKLDERKKKQDEELKKLDERKKKKDEMIKKLDERKKKLDEEIERNKKAGMLSIEEYLKELKPIANDTASSAHTYTGHIPANTSTLTTVPFDLPKSFWKSKIYMDMPLSFDSEQSVHEPALFLVRGIIRALKLQNVLEAVSMIPLMDTLPNISIWNREKVILGTIEVKKPERGDGERRRIFNGGTQVAGEIFEQLFLSRANNRMVPVAGMLTTFNSWQLVYTEETADCSDVELPTDEGSNKPSATPDGPNLLPDEEQTQRGGSKKRKATDQGNQDAVKIITKKKESGLLETLSNLDSTQKKPKTGRVVEEGIERSYNSTAPISFDGVVENNRKVVELIALFLKLCIKTMKSSPQSNVGGEIFACRAISTKKNGTRSFSLAEIEVEDGIDFSKPVDLSHNSTFYAVRQLGFGDTGVVCLGVEQQSGVACAIKIFRLANRDFEEVEKEAKLWETIYGSLGLSAKAFSSGRALIVMPFLQIPCNAEQRKRLYAEGKESLLYTGLQSLAATGYRHNDLKWNHVGTFVKDGTEHLAFCDFGNMECFGPDEDKSEWVEKAFVDLQNRSERLG